MVFQQGLFHVKMVIIEFHPSTHVLNVTLCVMIFYASVHSFSVICKLWVPVHGSLCIVHMCSYFCECDEEQHENTV